MLHHRLRGVGKERDLVYVGGNIGVYDGNANFSVSLTTLTGGVASSPSAGDIVVVAYAEVATTNTDMSVVTSGYTELADLYSSDSSDANLGIYAKLMGSSPDTAVIVTGGNETLYSAAVQVWRNTNVTSGIVAPVATATGTNTGRPNPPAVTPTVPGSVVLVVGAGTIDSGTSALLTAPSGITLFQTISHEYLALGIGAYVGWTSGAYDCGVFGGGGNNTYDSWCAASIILKPV